MTPEEAIATAIRDRLLGAIPAGMRHVQDNGPDPNGGTANITSAIQVDNTTQVSMGPPRYRMTGALIVTVYTQAGSGDSELRASCGSIAAAFRGGAIASPMVTFSPSPTVTGSVQRADGVGGLTLRIPFRADFT